MRDGGLVKTVQFKDGKYVGDPINAVKIFNEKEADELIVLDIDATTKGAEPDFKMIAHLALECRMPLCYGGGVKTAQQAKRIVGLGVEKVAMSSAAIENPKLITEIGEEIGNQSVVMVLDAKKRSFRGGYEVYTHNGKQEYWQGSVAARRASSVPRRWRDRHQLDRQRRHDEGLRSRSREESASRNVAADDGCWRRRFVAGHRRADRCVRRDRRLGGQSVRVQGRVQGGADQLSDARTERRAVSSRGGRSKRRYESLAACNVDRRLSHFGGGSIWKVSC